ncbi:MAG: coproporphyrinogen III oxidase family protein [Alphaproteobacteria bacterium]|nr:coproporphyrinogen III oxidase family protein [Alphaproteobacteria bacterium]
MSPSPWGVYVHVPWCRIRCPYCAFHVDPDRDGPPFDAFVDRVLVEVAARRATFVGDPHTVYLGGGTPSRLPTGALQRLVRGLVAPTTVEVTVEANPEDVDAAWVDAAIAAGVTRVSLGIQTLDPGHARRLGRAHTPAHGRRAAAVLRDAPLASWSADLMFALAGQSPADLDADLDALLALDPPHVSLYGLTIEEGTGYARAAERGALAPVDDDTWRLMLDAIVARLEAAGLHRYEISNFARDGHRSIHNAGYWDDRPYLGVGPSAHGYAPDGRRWADVSDTAAWIAGAAPVVEHPTALEGAADRLVSGLRSLAGLSVTALAARYGHVPDRAVVDRLVAHGLLAVDGAGMRLSPEGLYVADAVTAALVDGLVPVDPAAGHG